MSVKQISDVDTNPHLVNLINFVIAVAAISKEISFQRNDFKPPAEQERKLILGLELLNPSKLY
jgi:hypothetical protein